MGLGGAGQGMPGQDTRISLSSGALGRAWCCWPGRDWAKLCLVPAAHSPQARLWAGPTSPLLRSWQKFKISPPGWSIRLPGLGLVVGLSPSGGHHFLALLCFLKQLPALSELGALIRSSGDPGWAGGRTG